MICDPFQVFVTENVVTTRGPSLRDLLGFSVHYNSIDLMTKIWISVEVLLSLQTTIPESRFICFSGTVPISWAFICAFSFSLMKFFVIFLEVCRASFDTYCASVSKNTCAMCATVQKCACLPLLYDCSKCWWWQWNFYNILHFMVIHKRTYDFFLLIFRQR